MKAYKIIYNQKNEKIIYEVGKTYIFKSKPEMYKYYNFEGELRMNPELGFHFYKNPDDFIDDFIDDFHDSQDKIKDLTIFEIKILGNIINENSEKGNKTITDKFKVLRIVPKKEYNNIFNKCRFDDNNNLIYFKNYKNYYGVEYWYKYDDNSNCIYEKDSKGIEKWYEYDKNNNLIHYKTSYNKEFWCNYDKNNNLIYYKNNNGIEEWKKYDKNNNLIYSKNANIEYSIIIED